MLELQDLDALVAILFFLNLSLGAFLSFQDLSKRSVSMRLLYLKALILFGLSFYLFGAIALAFSLAGFSVYLLFSRFLKADSLYIGSLLPLLSSGSPIFLLVFCFCLVAFSSSFFYKNKGVKDVAGIPLIFALVEVPYLFFIFF